MLATLSLRTSRRPALAVMLRVYLNYAGRLRHFSAVHQNTCGCPESANRYQCRGNVKQTWQAIH